MPRHIITLPPLHHSPLARSFQTGLTATRLSTYQLPQLSCCNLTETLLLAWPPGSNATEMCWALDTLLELFVLCWKSVLAGLIAAHVSAAVTGCRRTAMSCYACLRHWLSPCPRYSLPLFSIANCLQWLMALITQASEAELIQLKAKVEMDMQELINMYHQVRMLVFCQVIVVCLLASAAFESVETPMLASESVCSCAC